MAAPTPATPATAAQLKSEDLLSAKVSQAAPRDTDPFILLVPSPTRASLGLRHLDFALRHPTHPDSSMPPAARSSASAAAPRLLVTDLCLSNAIVKAGTGLAVGVVASALLFRRRPWPVLLGLGFGAGQGYSDCERVFNPAAVPGYRIAGQEKAASPFSLSSPFSSVSPSQSSSAPAPSPSPSPSPSRAAVESTSVKVQDAVSSAKSKASDAASAAQEKASEVVGQGKGKAGEVEVKAEEKVDELIEGKKWV
ncbi:hypothetical protein JCM1841_005606 [Sporobolomyces salmonicolor]